jgi:MFS family permease
MWYCRHEAQFRQALFFSAASVAGAFSGLLAFGIAKMDGIGGLAGWRWIFILEGILTVVVAIIAFFTLYDFPETASFLTEEERAFVVYRLKYQGQQKNDEVRVAQDDSFQWKYVKAAFLDWQIWMSIVVYWGIVAPLYGISLFLPTIIRGLGFSRAAAQLLTVPIYITASVLAVVTAWVSDRYGKRSPFILGCLGIMAIGFIMCLSTGTPGVVYAGVFIAAAALYPAFPGNITWLSNSKPNAVCLDEITNIPRPCRIDKARNWTSYPDRHGQSRRSNGFQLLSIERFAPLYPRARPRAWLHLRWNSCRAVHGVELHAYQQEKGEADGRRGAQWIYARRAERAWRSCD